MFTNDAWSTTCPPVPIDVPDVVFKVGAISVSLKFRTCIVGVISSNGMFCDALTLDPPVAIPTLATDCVDSE